MFRLMVIFFLPTLSEPERLPIEAEITREPDIALTDSWVRLRSCCKRDERDPHTER